MENKRFLSFPKDFIWASATASYQIEGGFDEDGRSPSIWDVFSKTPGKVLNGETGDLACDHYHRWEKDVALMKNLGLQAYRFSTAWPRIIPGGTGSVNKPGLDFYDRLVDKLLSLGIQPFCTLYHWDLPQSLEDAGGWRNKATSEAFAQYAEAVVKRLSDRVQNWITLNEPWCSSILGYERGIHAPGAKEPKKVVRQVIHNLLYGHGLALQAIREHAVKPPQVGFAHNPEMVVPAFREKENWELAMKISYEESRWFLDPVLKGKYPKEQWDAAGVDGPEILEEEMNIISQPLDFLGLNIYHGALIAPDASRPQGYRLVPYPEGHPHTTMGWPVNADCMGVALDFVNKYYGVSKIYITENGCAYPEGPDDKGEVKDTKRIDYLQRHLAQVHAAIGRGIPVRGYFCWSLMDNYEWERGYEQRFGITHVDYKTQKRTVKQSGKWYGEVIRRNGFEYNPLNKSIPATG